MTYLLLSVPFLVAAVVLWAVRAKRYRHQGAVTGTVMAVLLILTVVFDNLMVAAGLVGYDDSNNLGIFLGRIPIEDLFYSVFVVLVVTAFWPKKAP